MVWGLNPSGGEVLCTHPDQPVGLPSLLYMGYWVSSPGVKQQRSGVDHPHTSSTEATERVVLYLYCPSELSWQVKE